MACFSRSRPHVRFPMALRRSSICRRRVAPKRCTRSRPSRQAWKIRSYIERQQLEWHLQGLVVALLCVVLSLMCVSHSCATVVQPRSFTMKANYLILQMSKNDVDHCLFRLVRQNGTVSFSAPNRTTPDRHKLRCHRSRFGEPGRFPEHPTSAILLLYSADDESPVPTHIHAFNENHASASTGTDAAQPRHRYNRSRCPRKEH